MVNVEVVDFPHFGQANADGSCRAANYGFHFDSLPYIEPFGIVNTGELSAKWKYDRCSHHRASKRPRPGFINPCNGLDARLPKHTLEIQHIENTRSIDPFFIVTFFEKLVDLSCTLTWVSPQFVQNCPVMVDLPEAVAPGSFLLVVCSISLISTRWSPSEKRNL